MRAGMAALDDSHRIRFDPVLLQDRHRLGGDVEGLDAHHQGALIRWSLTGLPPEVPALLSAGRVRVSRLCIIDASYSRILSPLTG